MFPNAILIRTEKKKVRIFVPGAGIEEGAS
jgi:hypothetical protein